METSRELIVLRDRSGGNWEIWLLDKEVVHSGHEILDYEVERLLKIMNVKVRYIFVDIWHYINIDYTLFQNDDWWYEFELEWEPYQ